jgi:hypothetical protein
MKKKPETHPWIKGKPGTHLWMKKSMDFTCGGRKV